MDGSGVGVVVAGWGRGSGAGGVGGGVGGQQGSSGWMG